MGEPFGRMAWWRACVLPIMRMEPIVPSTSEGASVSTAPPTA